MRSARRNFRGWTSAAMLPLLAVVLPALGAVGLTGPLREGAEWLRSESGWTLPAFVLGASVASGLAVMPTHAVSLAAGYVYGLAGGMAAAMAAVFGATIVGYLAARRLSSHQLRAWIDRSPRGRTLAASLVDARGGRALLAVTLVRLPPQVPFALANVLAAMLRMRPTTFLAGTMLGMAPRVALLVWLGSELAAWDQAATPASWLAFAATASIIGLAGLGVIAWRVLAAATPRPSPDADAQTDAAVNPESAAIY